MRKLAKALGVEAMSLYNHVANKDDILDGIVEIVFSEIELPPTGVDWKTAMRRRAISTRQALARHHWAVGLMESRMRPGPANVRLHDAVLGCLRAGGLLGRDGRPRLLGAGQLHLRVRPTGEGVRRPAATALPADEESLSETDARQLPADYYPYIAEIVGGYVTTPGYRVR